MTLEMKFNDLASAILKNATKNISIVHNESQQAGNTRQMSQSFPLFKMKVLVPLDANELLVEWLYGKSLAQTEHFPVDLKEKAQASDLFYHHSAPLLSLYNLILAP